MSRSSRNGDRIPRERKQPHKLPKLGYYLIVTNTEATERCYLEGFYEMLPETVKDKIVIKSEKAKTKDMIEKCIQLTRYEAQYRIPWIIFDRDEEIDFDNIIHDAEYKGINVGWSNPCFEIWLYAYFGEMPMLHNSWSCCKEFEKVYKRNTGLKYSKSDHQLYEKIFRVGDEEKAIRLADQKLKQ